MSRVAFVVQRVGPYHHARLSAFSTCPGVELTVIEYRIDEKVYAWAPVARGEEYPRLQVSSRKALKQALVELDPQAVVCVGYSDPEIHQAMSWAVSRRVPLVTCSDSTLEDEKRHWLKEALKRSLVRFFSCGLVAGTRAHAYLETLGLARDRRFTPWDVVDNFHFEQGAAVVRKTRENARQKLALPANYFLCVSRFVEKKNLTRLVEGYARYVNTSDGEAWALILLGSGPLEPELRRATSAYHLEEKVQFTGFLQYDELPAYYGLAQAFILPSLSDQWGLVVNEAMAAGLPVLVSASCGCAADLVSGGDNGFVFDPENVDAIAEVLKNLAKMEKDRLASMGQRSCEIIRRFSPEAFAEGLHEAVGCALNKPHREKSIVGRAIIDLLALRPVRNPVQ